jgi:hypothetical protein
MTARQVAGKRSSARLVFSPADLADFAAQAIINKRTLAVPEGHG